MKNILIAVTALALVGCDKLPGAQKTVTITNIPPEFSSSPGETESGGALETVTQAGKLRAGQRAAQTIRDVSAKERAAQEEVYGGE